MATDVFSANPRSFKMDRKSPLAIELKVFVTQKLIEFIGNYTDDVLAEYIVVLVCNGKHQNQARDDLEAFLGERSGEFVSWLWDLLLETVDQYHKPLDDVYNKQRICRMKVLQNHAIDKVDNLSDEKQFCQSTRAPKPASSNDVQVSEGFQHCYPGFDVSLDERNTKEVWAQKCKHEVSKKYGSSEDNRNEGLKYGSSRMKGSSEISAGGEQSVPYVDQHRKTVHNNGNGLHHQLLHSPNREPASRNLLSVIAEDPHSRLFSGTQLSSRANDSVSHQKPRPRGNVWDRLGKPCDENTIVRGKKIEVENFDVIKRSIVENNGEGLDRHQLMVFVPGSGLNRRSLGEVHVLDNSCGIVTSNTKPDECKRLERGLNTLSSPHGAINPNRKRQFAEIGPGPANGSVSLGDSKHRHLQDKEAYKKLQIPASVSSRSKSLNSVASGTKKPGDLKTYRAFISPDTALQPRDNKMSRTKLISEASAATAATQTLVSNCSPLGTKSEAINGEEDVNTNLNRVQATKLISEASADATKTLVSNFSLLGTKSEINSEEDVNNVLNPVQAQMLDVKSRLRQIETEMSKLRSKRVGMSNDGKLNSSPSFGALNHPEEDISSRTVYVTNVHFAATKEALSLHFAKCGVVVKVIILNDRVTAQPKGSAYVTFASKESAEKAVALSGTSFWSRTLKVMKKAEMSVVAKAPIQMGEKVSQSQFAQPNRKVVLGRPYTRSHLQWRRDQPVNGGHSGSSPEGGVKALEVVEQDGANSGSHPTYADVGSAETQAGA